MNQEIYCSTDCESDGPYPGDYSLLSFATAAYSPDGKLIDTFQANLRTLPGKTGHPSTMKWWEENKEAYLIATKDPQPPEVVMPRYVKWLKGLPGKPVFVGMPAGYDFTFVYWYLMKFAGESPYSFSALDLKTMAMVLLNCGYRQASKNRMPGRWFDPRLAHTHQAIDDALEQGYTFCKMFKEARDEFGRNLKLQQENEQLKKRLSDDSWSRERQMGS